MGDSIHNWIARRKTKTGRCSECGAERYTEWANVSGEYRYDVDDFIELCKPCHCRLDGQPERMCEQMKGNTLFLGRKHTPETIAKMSAARTEHYARKRAAAG